ncbi:hypothetical protein CC1G_08754 [Coprinopsis cinerea okayama7|uniref:Uncharacterized protein n=1 Tax=Coprinopsis cinerea (strain Okayama-7 / 130 / ATCC MYA-4618 / FGSC 9003) TaxID=240176 RepID=A8NJ15_COPC7|nr:hypothetical protein CC1G_08754 [Coprinopsis cinerea okayama7\|eukprot:XP_001834123.2 hypothetical protein CC1G_08754 [Coprinopsis cinerea okayama7\
MLVPLERHTPSPIVRNSPPSLAVTNYTDDNPNQHQRHSRMLDAFKIKPFDLEPVLAEWTDGPVFKGNPKKDPPVEEWLEKIKEGCTERKIPEEYWYKVGQHFMGRKAKARFDEVKQVVAKVNGGNYRWTWKKFKVAMTNMGWDIDPQATETIKVQKKGSGFWFTRKKSEEKGESKEPSVSSSSSTESKRPSPPTRSNTLLWGKKPVVEEPEEIFTPGTRPPPTRSKTLIGDSSFWLMRSATKDEDSSKDSKDTKEGKEKDTRSSRPAHQKAKSETAVSKRAQSESRKDVAKSNPSEGEEGTTAQAPVWLLNACNALDFLTSEHPKAMSVISAVLITVGSIPSIPAISAGAGGAILASGAAHAIGAIAVGIGQALGASAIKNTQERQNSNGN